MTEFRETAPLSIHATFMERCRGKCGRTKAGSVAVVLCNGTLLKYFVLFELKWNHETGRDQSSVSCDVIFLPKKRLNRKKKITIFWNTKFFHAGHPEKFELKRRE